MSDLEIQTGLRALSAAPEYLQSMSLDRLQAFITLFENSYQSKLFSLFKETINACHQYLLENKTIWLRDDQYSTTSWHRPILADNNDAFVISWCNMVYIFPNTQKSSYPWIEYQISQLKNHYILSKFSSLNDLLFLNRPKLVETTSLRLKLEQPTPTTSDWPAPGNTICSLCFEVPENKRCQRYL